MSGTKLPSPEDAWVEEKKVREYLLNLDHEYGGSKAKFFKERGFTDEEWVKLRAALIVQGTTNLVVKTTPNPYGARYVVDCNCPCPDKSTPCIRSVWEIRADDARPRLITAHPR